MSTNEHKQVSDSDAVEIAPQDVTALSYPELQRECKRLGLKATGNVAVPRQRLVNGSDSDFNPNITAESEGK